MGAAQRELASELGSATAAAAAAAAAGFALDPEAPPGEEVTAALRSMLRLPGVERVTLLGPDHAPPIALTQAGPVTPHWQSIEEVQKGQVLSADHLRVTREIQVAERTDGLLIVEASLKRASQRHAEWVGAAARMFIAVVLLALALAPWIARALVSPWVHAIRRLHTRALGASEVDPDPELALEAIERAFIARIEDARGPRPEHSGAPSAGSTVDERASRAAFLSNTGHELRTPLHAIVTTGSLLLDTALDPEQHALVAQVLRAADALSESVEDLNELASLESGHFELELREFEPEETIDDIVDLIAPLARDRDVEVLARIDASVPTRLRADSRRFRRLAMHLVDNAVRHTEHGIVEVRLALAQDEAGARLALAVRDTGAGISAEAQATMFDDLAAINRDERGLRGGMGIGLVLSARIARAMGGELEFESALLSGSVFRAHVPVEPVASAPHAFPLSGQRVLVLDDDARSASHLVDLLIEEGADVVSESTAYSGFEALARGEAFDFVLLDAGLAGRDAFLGGVETMPSVSRRQPRLVLVHPTLGRRLPERSTDDAVAAQVVKPITRRALRRALEVAREERGTTLPASAGAVVTAGAESAVTVERAREHLGARMTANEPRPTPSSGELSAISAAAIQGVRVLLVDDNETNRQLVQYLLGKRGYSVDIAVDGQRAVDAFSVGTYDVVLMDCQMPVMDGFEATRRIRALEVGRSRRTPVLAMSAGAFGDDVQACRHAGMDDHIAKPFQPKDMLAWLEGWVTKSLQDPHGNVAGAPRRRTTARDAGLVPPPLPSASGALDDGVLGPLLDDEGGRALAEELVATFMSSGPETVAGLERHLEAGDLRDVARIAHRFVSTSGSVGAMRLARLLREVESACERGERDAAHQLLSRAGGELAVVSRALEARLSGAR